MTHDDDDDRPTPTDSTRALSRRALLAAGSGVALAGVTFGAGPARGADDKPLPKVPRRVLGKTKQKIPILLFGAGFRLDPRFDPKLAEAVRFGVNYFDAADCYAGGTCEPAIGAFHTRMKNRKDIWITSKSDEHSPEGMTETLQAGLRKLKTDYVDLYFLHALQEEEYLSPAMEKTVAKLKKEGKMRFFGFSCHHGNVAELLHAAAKRPWIDAVMFRYNFRKYGDKALNSAIDAARKADVGLIAMKTQGSEASFRDAWKKFEKTGKWTKHQAVLKAVWEDERITAAVSEMDTFDKLRENIAAALDKSKLTAVEREALERYAAATRSRACDGCDHICNPAVDGPVRIGDTMRALMYADVYGDRDKALESFARLPVAARNLSGIDFSPANRACPHGVDVVAEMRRAARLFHA